MLKQKKLALAVNLASLGLVGSLFTSTIAVAQDDAPVVEEVHITGSRIVRTSDYQEGSQVVSIDRKAIDALGNLIIADVLRESPLNAYGSFTERSGSSAQSNATVDLRGLGEERTLVTIDGRRMVGSPNQGASIINVNMIPMSAVERIDILADGASAVYGSDAVAGVVNMQMRRDFEGLEFTIRGGDRSNDDGSEFGASLVGGVTSDRGNITFALEHNRRDPIWDRERSYTAPWVRDTDGDGQIEAYVDTDGYSIYGASIWLYEPGDNPTDPPRFDRILAAANCQEGNGFLGEVEADIDWGYPADLDQNTYCMYGYADISANKAALDRNNAYLNAEFTINDKMDFFTTALISRVESFGRFAPPAATWPDMPEDSPYIPFDIDELIANGDITVGPDDADGDGELDPNYSITGFYRWTNIGPRDNVVTDTQIDFTSGFRGDVTDNISYETYFQKSTYDSKEFGYYYLSYTGLDYVLENGIDPFSEEGAGAMSSTTTQDNFTEMLKLYGHMQFGMGSLGGGEVLGLFGFEQMEIDYQNKYDRHSETGYVGGSAGNSSNGDRDIFAMFAEAVLPFSDTLEVNAALRYDDYSDFGTAVSPSVSAVWGVSDDVTLRGRWGMGFRAPGLDQLYGPETFSAEDASDQATCAVNNIAPEDCPTSQYDTYFYTNPDLDAEESDSLSMGVKWDITDTLTLDVAYWDITIDDVIIQPTTQSVLFAEAAGFPFDPSENTWVDRSGGRPVIHSSYVNQGELAATGIDIQLDYGVDIGFGFLNSNILISQQLGYDQSAYFGGPTQETAGFNLQPELKAQWALGWTMDRHAVDLIINYTGPHSQQDFIDFDDSGNAFLDTSNMELDSWTTMNLSYAFDAGGLGLFKVGARNLTNEDPVLDRTGLYPTDHYDLYDNTGRVIFGEYSIKF